MRLLPTIKTGGTSVCEAEWEAEGRYLQFVWGAFVVELSLCRRRAADYSADDRGDA